jgi:predicted 3-demethylubiquinone-9 3-methyltransferase (glyoxalase superfamily)
MAADTIVPCLWFDDQAEEAAAFYVDVFPAARLGAVARYPSSGPNPSGKPPGSVLTVECTLAGQDFTLLNGGPTFTINPSISFFVYVPSAQAVDRLYGALAADGTTMMPLDAYPWSERYAWVMDRFGATWQVMAVPEIERATIAPCLMFTDAQRGRAQEAIDRYVATFPGSRVEHVEYYTNGEGPEGTVKHARLTLAGQPLTAMDSPIDHGFDFNEAVSLQVMCADQDEVDRYWRELAAGGEEGPCGWLKDRFGVSWQVVPRAIGEWLTHPDPRARDRAFQAMLGMGKLDVAALQQALAGR